ncbi:MAG TPA: hypothetical protein VJ904_14965 [Tichowtungia sp.]|nr:hypothetical protein [Tichowtungia sp.]
MKLCIKYLLLIHIACGICFAETDVRRNFGLLGAIKKYEELSGKQVDLVAGAFVEDAIRLESFDVSVEQQLNSIEAQLAKNGIGIFRLNDSRVVVTWKEPVADPARKILSFFKESKRTFHMGAVSVNTRLTPEVLKLKEDAKQKKELVQRIRMCDEEWQRYWERSKGSAVWPIEKRRLLQEEQESILERLNQENEEYVIARQAFLNAAHLAWVAELECVINDFEERGLAFPMMWMSQYPY